MGWSAHAIKDVGIIIDDFKVFEEAAKKVIKNYGSCDLFLNIGVLDCSDCAIALQEATGMACWLDDLSHEEVKKYYEKANWKNVKDDIEPALAASAKEFLEVCAKNGFGIMFSW